MVKSLNYITFPFNTIQQQHSMILFPLCPDTTMLIITQFNLKSGLVRPQHTFPFCVSVSQMSCSPEKSVAFLDVVNIYGFCFAQQELNLHLQMQQRTVFTDKGFLKYSLACVVIFITKACQFLIQFLNCWTVCSRSSSQSGD